MRSIVDRRGSERSARGFVLATLVVLGLAVCLGFAPGAHAATVTVASYNTGNCYPFLCNDSGISSGQSIEYQQVYASTAFSAPISITALTFFFASEFGGSSLVLNGNYQVSLSTTAAPINGLSSIAANNIGPDNVTFANFNVFSNDVDSDPSFSITGGPFLYDPCRGNLLIDLVITNQDNVPNGSGNGYIQADSSGTETSRLFAFDSSGVGTTDSVGLVTEFTFTPGTTTCKDVQKTNYFSNANTTGGQAFVNITDPLEASSGQPEEICAMIYVFDTSQALQECCGCPITADGLLTLNITDDLAASPAAGGNLLVDGSIRILSANPAVASSPPSSKPPGTNCDLRSGQCCDPTGTTANLALRRTLRAWGGHVQDTASTETAFEDVPIAPGDAGALAEACDSIVRLGAGQGTCSCGTGSATTSNASPLRIAPTRRAVLNRFRSTVPRR